MSENGRELAKAALVEGLREARELHQNENGQESVEKRATIPYTELPEAKPGAPLFLEWNTYRREAGRLLAEGNEGRFVLIKGEEIIGIWPTREEAKAVSLQKYLMQPALIHQVQTQERIIRGPQLVRRCLN